ncbi:MAG: glutathione S-transferase family protein [Pseudolabrys sp.]|jgi:glutathione S-transferase
MKLIGFPPSPNTWKVRAVAAHLGIPIDFELVDLTKGASHAADYLSLNPTGRAPTLIDGDLKLWESTAIMQYLGSQKPNTLWPDDARTRADIMRWQSWQLAHFSKEGCEPLLFQRIVKQILNLGPPDEAIVARGLECFARDAAVLDEHLAKQSYLVGDDATLADFSVAAPLLYAERADLPLAAYPRAKDWFDRVAALPCWRETMPQFTAAAAA